MINDAIMYNICIYILRLEHLIAYSKLLLL